MTASVNKEDSTIKSREDESKEFTLSKSIVWQLYLDRFLASWGDRTWNFAVGLFLIKLYPDSLVLAGIRGICSSIAIILVSPTIGRWVQKSPRLRTAKVTLFAQNGSITLSALFVLLYFLRSHIQCPVYHQVMTIISPILFVLFSIVANAFSCAYSLMMEKDWVLTLVTKETQLADVNAVLRRIDLTCQTLAPFMTGFLLQYSETLTATILCIFNLVSGLVEYFILRRIYQIGPPEIRVSKPKTTDTQTKALDLVSIKEYYSQFLIPGLSFSFTYLTVIGFDATTVGFLSSNGVSDLLIGTISVCAGISGIIGTIIYQYMTRIMALKATGTFGYILDITLIAPCLVIVYNPVPSLITGTLYGIQVQLLLFIAGIILSRMGLWALDLSVNQLIQTTTENPAVIGGVQNSVNIALELIKYCLVTILPDLNQFWILCLVSYLLLVTGAVLFVFYTIFPKIKPKLILEQMHL